MPLETFFLLPIASLFFPTTPSSLFSTRTHDTPLHVLRHLHRTHASRFCTCTYCTYCPTAPACSIFDPRKCSSLLLSFLPPLCTICC
ncbi:hypothetical protein C8Q73DRAFT_16885 [Cubamyces lactineus]|nr:hypothetical protein C8Q73DRAFT_16885 [Cubamyces lactineus]